jgi:hypothetical protein
LGRLLLSCLGVLVLAGFLVGLSSFSGGRVTLEGRLEVVHGDNFAQGSADFRYRLVTDQATYELRFDDQNPQLPRSTRVRVHGTRNGKEFDVVPGGVQASGEPVAATTGQKKVAVILFNFSNDGSQPYTPALAYGVAFSNPDSVAAYYAENSHSQLTLTGDVFGWYTIPVTNANCDFGGWGNAADQQATLDGVNLAAYDYVVYAFPGASSCGWAGLAYLPGTRSWLNGAGAMGLYVMAHELGHNFATHHASSLSCVQNGVRVSLSANPADCTADEYGDPNSVMGSGGTRHHTNFARGNFGWLTAANTKDVTASGTFTLAPVEGDYPGAIQALRIEREPGSYLSLEFRQPYGTYFDTYPPNDPVVNGVTVRVTPSYSVLTQSKLVDATASTTSFLDAPLGVGKTLSDPKTSIQVTTLSVSPSGASVKITFPGGREPPPPPPGADTTPPTAPTNLIATRSRSGAVALRWSASTDNVGVTSYRIFRDGQFLIAVSGTSLSYADQPPAGTHSYYVRAMDAAGNQSPPSNTATITA